MYTTIGLLTLRVPPDHTSDADNLLPSFNPPPYTVTLKDNFSLKDVKESVLGSTLTVIFESATTVAYFELGDPTFVTFLGNL